MRFDKKRDGIFIIFTVIILVLLSIFPYSVEAQSSCSPACALDQICKNSVCVNTCSDGTPVGTCSVRKPLMCDQNERLVNDITKCGCPNGKVPLPSGYCGVVINHTSFLTDDFEAGRLEDLNIIPIRAGLSNLATGMNITLKGFICPKPYINITSPPNSPSLNGVIVNLTEIYGKNGEKVLIDGAASPFYTGEYTLISDNSTINNSVVAYSLYGDLCYIPNNSTQPYVQLDLGSVKDFSEVTLSFSYPFITDYQILYSTNNINWNVAYSGHDELDLKNTYEDHWSFGSYGKNDDGYTKVYRDLKTGGILSFQTKIGGVNYQTQQFAHHFNPVSGRYVRFVPKNWFERAGLYEIEIHNTNSQVQLATSWDNSVSQTRYVKNGSYESSIFFANVSQSDLNYQKLFWSLSSNSFSDKRTIRNNALQVPEYGFIQYDTGDLNDYYSTTRFPNDLSERIFGYPGNPGSGNIGGSPNAGAVPLTLANTPNSYIDNGLANNAQLFNGGIGNSALRLDGVDDYAWATADPLLRLEDNFTISAWVKPENGGPVLSKGAGNDVDTDYSLEVVTFGTQGQIKFFIRNQLYATATNLQIDNGWHYIAITFEKPGILKFYLDDDLVYTDNNVNGNYARVPYNAPYYEYYNEATTWENAFRIGAHGISAVTPFKGKIDEIMIYDRALSLSEITQLKDIQKARLDKDGAVGALPDNLNKLLLAYWDFSQSLPANSYVAYQYWSDYTKSRWNNGNKIPNRVAPQYSQILSGSYPEAGQSNVAYGPPKCAFDDKWVGQPTTSGGVPNLPCVYHPAEAAFQYPYYEGSVSYALDSSNYRTDLGVVFGANTTADSVKGKALQLDGVDDYLSKPVPAMGGLDVNKKVDHLNIGTGDFSGSVWIKDPSVQWSGVFSKGRGNPGFGPSDLLAGAYDLFVSRNGDSVGVAFRIIDADKNVRIVEASYAGASQWHHISFTLNRASQEMKIYIDGVLTGTNSASISSASMSNNYPFVIGAQQFMQTALPLIGNYKGKIDELRLYGRLLSASEIQQLAQEKNTPVPNSLDIGLKGHWKFDEENYAYWPKAISVAHGIVFYVPAGVVIDRVAVSELQDRTSYIELRNIGALSKEPTGEYNKVSVFDLPQRQISPGTFYRLYLYSRVVPGLHERTPLIWEVGLLETEDANTLGAGNINDLYVGFQFRSGNSENEVKNALWTGPDGTINTFYTTSGQAINSMHKGNSYYQYRFIASTNDNRYTPVVDNITISYSGRINQAPRAYIRNPGKIFTLDNKEFDGSLSRDDGFITKYEWDFGDGTIGVGQKVNHQYSKPGEYLVHLTVYDSSGFKGETYLTVQVEPFNCLTNDGVGNADSEIFSSISGNNVQGMVIDALTEYADKHSLSNVNEVNTAEEYMDAALEYLDKHMSYLTPREQCYQNNGGLQRWPVSLDRINSISPKCGCPEGADFCGNCMDFSIAFTTLVRAMGVNSKCVYSGITEMGAIVPQLQGGHAYNIILYKGKYRMVEPQGNSLTSKFKINALLWDNKEIPFYMTGSILNDQVGHYEDFGSPISSTIGLTRQNLMNSRIMNYPGSTGLPDSGRKCIPEGYINLSTEKQRLDFVAQQMYLWNYVVDPQAYQSSPDKCTYAVTFNLQKILHRTPTSTELSKFENCTSNGNGIQWYDYPQYVSQFGQEFKLAFTRFALNDNSKTANDFMTINENVFLTKLYEYLIGYPITERNTDMKDYLAKTWHKDTKYSFYRSLYTNYDPLEVFEDVCP